jgi:lipoprotein-anchoring transpeptidase ErfK/SrfK
MLALQLPPIAPTYLPHRPASDERRADRTNSQADAPLHLIIVVTATVRRFFHARAIYLGASLYRIHGSNGPDKIGQAVSSGCIRMTNQDVIDLYNRVQIGATVIVQ